MKVEWLSFKNFYLARKVDMLMVEDSDKYFLFLDDPITELKCELDKNPSDTTDLDEFETTYKILCNPEKNFKVRAGTPLNEHQLQPWGCNRGYFKSKNNGGDDYICAITLSNKSQDGLTFTYSNCSLIPSVGNYVFQDNETKRSWITSVDTQNNTVTFEMPELDNGEGIYTRGHYVDVKVRDWFNPMYIWGVTLTIQEYDSLGILDASPSGDFMEFSVVDRDDLFLIDDVTQSLFGVDAVDAAPYLEALGFEQNGEYGHWTKYYDESWVININNVFIESPDKSPASLMAGLYLRLSIFTLSNDEHSHKIFVDYYPTAMT